MKSESNSYSDAAALPIDSRRNDFSKAFATKRIVVSAPTATGKSTRIPHWCTEELGPAGRVLVIEPRRVACRALARFVSDRLNSPLGGMVGYRVQHDDRSSAETRILYVTPGMAIRILQGGGIIKWDVVILDEFHERGLETDLVLAICRREKAERILVMSATLEVDRVAEYLGAGKLEVSGRVFPVTVGYESENELPSPRNLADRVDRAVRGLGDPGGDVLVFLPGKGEIAACMDRLKNTGLEILALHGGLPPEMQDRVFQPAGKPRVILTTNVAETSITIPGVAVVIDSGLVRQTFYRDGRTILGLRIISHASAEQRRGRAGRLRPGRCTRLWGENAVLEEATSPEILRQDLAYAVLAAAAAGYSLSELPMLDLPRSFAVKNAEADLSSLGALDGQRRITTIGRDMFMLPLDVSYARVLLEARRGEYPAAVLQSLVDLVSVLNLDRPLIGHSPRGEDTDDIREARHLLTRCGCDATILIRALRSTSPETLALNPRVYREARRVSGQIRGVLEIRPPSPAEAKAIDTGKMALAWLRAVPGAGFVRRAKRDAWANDAGVEVILPRESSVRTDARALVVAARRTIEGKSGRKMTLASCAIPVDPELLAQAELGDFRLGSVEFTGNTVVSRIDRIYSGTVLQSDEMEPRGELAVQAVTRLITESRLLPGVAEHLKNEMESYNLACRLEPAGGREPVDPDRWIADRLRRLGLERGSDAAALTDSDFEFRGLDDDEREAFDKRYPRRLNLGNQQCEVEYDPASRTITLVKTSGLSRQPPDPRYLPSWPGWRVRYRDRQRVIPLKER